MTLSRDQCNHGAVRHTEACRITRLRVPTAIHGQVLTVDKGRFWVGDEGHRGGDLFRPTKTANAYELLHRLGGWAAIIWAQFGIDRTWLHVVDRNARRSKLPRKRHPRQEICIR